MCKAPFWLLLALVLLSPSCTRPHEESPEVLEGPRTVRVMSFNIRYGTAKDGENHWDGRHQDVLATIRDQAPHLLGLQEALHFQVEYLSEALPEYGVHGVGRDGGEGGEYSCLFVNERRFEVLSSDTFWLSEEPDAVASRGWDAALHRICTWAVLRDRQTEQKLLWMNTHFDHRGKVARERSGALIHERIRGWGELPVLVTGDLNAGEESAALLALKGDLLRDSYRVLHPEDREVGTFNGFSGRRDGPKIDYVLCGPQWRVLSASIDRRSFGGRSPSDHFPVLAELEL